MRHPGAQFLLLKIRFVVDEHQRNLADQLRDEVRVVVRDLEHPGQVVCQFERIDAGDSSRG